MDIKPGLYKIKQFGTYCLMDVVEEKGGLFYSIGAELYQPIKELDKYFSQPIEIIKEVHPLDPVINVKAIVKWQDLYQDHFEVLTTDTKHLRRLFDKYPKLLSHLKNDFRAKY